MTPSQQQKRAGLVMVMAGGSVLVAAAVGYQYWIARKRGLLQISSDRLSSRKGRGWGWSWSGRTGAMSQEKNETNVEKAQLEVSDYPDVVRDIRVEDEHFGTKVGDPYRWLEDPDSHVTKNSCKMTKKFEETMTKIYNYPKIGIPFRRGNFYYFYHNSGLQQHYVLYYIKNLQDYATDDGNQLNNKVSVFLDPNTFSDDGTIALSSLSFSHDGSMVSYATSSGGSDWVTIHIGKVKPDGKLEMLGETLEHVKFTSMTWTHDNRGLFYNRYTKPTGDSELGTETQKNTNQELWFHVAGTPQSEDILCLNFPDKPEWMVSTEITHDGQYLLLSIFEGCDPVNMLYMIDLGSNLTKLTKSMERPLFVEEDKLSSVAQVEQSKCIKMQKVVSTFIGLFDYVLNDGSTFLFRTNYKSPMYRAVQVDIASVDAEANIDEWKTIIAEEKSLLESVDVLKGNNLIARYLEDVKTKLQLRDAQSGRILKNYDIPIGSIYHISCRPQDSDFFFKLMSFTNPGIAYHCQLDRENEPYILHRTVVESIHEDDFVTTQVFATNKKDGEKIPVFITHLKGMELDGRNPALLYGYGGFNISITPSFSISKLIFVKKFGGVYAVANLRGGGEYGEDWHSAGKLEKKQNVFDDFMSCADYLCDAKYTCSSKLAIEGGSNGGLLVGACLNQSPEKIGCAIAHVGVMDMLRFHLFTIGSAWKSEFGSPDAEDDFRNIIKYSPLHNVKQHKDPTIQAPSTLLLTADHDDRVVPLHSLKYIAELQYKHCKVGDGRQRNPLIIRVDTRAGHGAGKPTQKVIEEAAEMYGFVAQQLEASWRE